VGKQGEQVMRGSLSRGRATSAQVDIQADTLRNELRFSIVDGDGHRHPWTVAMIRKKPVPLPAMFAPIVRLGRHGDAVALSSIQLYLPSNILRQQLATVPLGVLVSELERALAMPDPSFTEGELQDAQIKLNEAKDVQSRAELGSGCPFVWLDAAALRSSAESMPRLLPMQALQEEHPDWFHTEMLTLEDACRRSFAHDHVAISHRWDERNSPDPSGEQLQAIRGYLQEHPMISRVWIE